MLSESPKLSLANPVPALQSAGLTISGQMTTDEDPVALTVPVLLSAMGEFVPGRPLAQLAEPRTRIWFELIQA